MTQQLLNLIKEWEEVFGDTYMLNNGQSYLSALSIQNKVILESFQKKFEWEKNCKHHQNNNI
jgi:hypothetical protein